MKGTRRDVLFQLKQWSRDQQDKRVFWLNDLAGTGKSTIAQTFAEMCFADGKLGVSFFCSWDFNDRSNLRSILPTVAFQLAHLYPEFRKELLPVLKTSPDVRRETLCSQMEKHVVGPFQATEISTLIVIDALDECRDEEPASALLSVLSRYVDKIPSVKFFITGRPEPRIRSGFRLESLQPHTDVLKLHEVQPSSVDSDIKLFLRTQFIEIAKTRTEVTAALRVGLAHIALTFCARRQLASSSMPQQLSSLFHLVVTHLMRGLTSLFHFHKTLLMKGGWALIFSISRSWSKLSMMWIHMTTSPTPISNLWWGQWCSSSSHSPLTPSQTSSGTVALHPEYPAPLEPSTPSSLSQITEINQSRSSTNHLLTSSQIQNGAPTTTSL